MKVRCINNEGTNLIKGDIYDVMIIDKFDNCMINDDIYKLNRFSFVLDENDKLDTDEYDWLDQELF